MLIQQDESEDSEVTSFLFARPTFFAKTLLKAWGENILNVQAGEVKVCNKFGAVHGSDQTLRVGSCLVDPTRPVIFLWLSTCHLTQPVIF